MKEDQKQLVLAAIKSLCIISICATILISLYLIKESVIRGASTVEEFVKQIDVLTYNQLKEIKTYFGDVKSANGDDLIVANVIYETEYEIRDEKKDFWSSFLFGYGISMGTNVVKIRCPTEHKYFIKISDPWYINVSNGIIYIKQPVIRQLHPPSVRLEKMEIETERGWLRGSVNELQQQALKDFMNAATAKGEQALPDVKYKCNESIKKFVNNWLLKLKDVNVSGIRVEITDEIPVCNQPDINIQINDSSKKIM